MENNNYPSIIQIDDILVSSDILTEFFECDYEKCKGGCCVVGDSGAPLEECECEAIENEYNKFSLLMTQQQRDIVAKDGFFVVDVDGDIVTPLVNNSEECVYSLFDENHNCFCSIERSYFNGCTQFRKPISCWIYPIRMTKLSSGLTALNLHRWHLCKDAFARGKRDKVYVYQFLKEPIIKYFGKEFYEALDVASISLRASS
jgi:hypothetical protein